MVTNIKKLELISYIIVVGFLIIMGILFSAEVSLIIALIIWTVLFIRSMSHIHDYTALFFFLISFFVFLLGREVSYTFFGLKRYYLYLEDYNGFSFNLISVSLVSIYIGICLGRKKGLGLKKTKVQNYRYMDRMPNIQKVCKLVFLSSYLVAIIVVFLQIKITRNLGYAFSYLSTSGSVAPAIVIYFGGFMGISICLLLATKPSRRESAIILFLYEIYAILTLFTGHRYTFISISMFVLLYILIRSRIDGTVITKKYIFFIIIIFPLLAILMNYLNAVRDGGQFEFSNIGNTMIDFFDQQGGSVNVIKRIKYYEKNLEDMKLVSFSNLRTLVFNNFLARKIFHTNAFTGNSIKHALEGFSLSHRLSYYEYGEYYLLGRGVGSCYIAELYHDFSIIGVIIGNLVYGWLLNKINSVELNNFFKDGILLAMFNYIILAPRDSFDNIIGGIFSLYSLLGLFVMWILIKLVKNNN